jgi:putative ABC transport system substrate-binding protein
MNRRAFLCGLTGALAAPLAAEAQQSGKVWRIGYLGNFPFTPTNSSLLAVFTDGLREYGYVEGKNLTIELRFAHGREERYPELVRELLQANVDLVVTVQTTAALALKQGAPALPVVLLGSGNPVEAGLVQSLARPGGSITGLSNQVGDLDGKIVQLARELVPRMSRLTVLWDPTNHPSARSVDILKALAAKEGLSVSPVSAPVERPDELERAISAIARERPDVLLVQGVGAYLSHAAAIGQLATRYRIPTICAFSSMTRAAF